MKFLALYSQKTLSLLRRVLAPFSCLAERGHPFSFLAVPSCEAGLAYSHDVTILPNWEFTLEEVEHVCQVASDGRVFVYDLSDPALLSDEGVRAVIQYACRLVTVPNEFLLREVQAVIGKHNQMSRVAITPSVIDLPYMVGAYKERGVATHSPTQVGGHPPGDTSPPSEHDDGGTSSPTYLGTSSPAYPPGSDPPIVIGCFGPHDWELVRPAIERVSEKSPRTVFVGDAYAHEVLGSLLYHLDPTVENYPQMLLSCAFGLCPYDGNTGRETLWAHEYGILSRPVIAASNSPYSRVLTRDSARFVGGHDTEHWVEAMLDWIRDPHLRVRYGNAAFCLANEQRTTQRVKEYLKAYAPLQTYVHTGLQSHHPHHPHHPPLPVQMLPHSSSLV